MVYIFQTIILYIYIYLCIYHELVNYIEFITPRRFLVTPKWSHGPNLRGGNQEYGFAHAIEARPHQRQGMLVPHKMNRAT